MDSPARITHRARPRFAAAITLVLAACLSVAACSNGDSDPVIAESHRALPTNTATGSDASETTAQICQDIGTQSTSLMQPIMPMLQGTANASQISSDIDQIRIATAQWIAALRDGASKAQDSQVATELRTAANQIDAASSNGFNNVTDGFSLATGLEGILIAAGQLYIACPDVVHLH